jgi:CHAT domain-containing protein
MTMRITALPTFLGGLALALIGGCQSLPPSAVMSDSATADAQTGTPVGKNQVGEACEYRANTLRDVDLDAARAFGVWCGTWRQPSGRIYEASQPRESSAQLVQLATASLWRSYLNQRQTCTAPAATTILDGVPAALLQCTERNGGWPHVAIAATLGGKTYMTDAVPSAVPAVEATLASLAGRALPAATARRSAATTLLEQRLSAQPFGSGDLDRYFGLMRLGDNKNAVDDFSGAEDAFRDALAVQQNILGPSNPGLAMPLMHLALQISNQQRFEEAGALFTRASGLLADTSDALDKARLDYYLAMHALNQNQGDQAKALATKAEKEYAAFVPPGMEEAARRGTAPQGGIGRGAALASLQPLIVDPQAQEGIRGLSAVWRLEATMAYDGGAYPESRKIADEGQALLDVSGINPPGTRPRVIRIAALSDAAIGDVVAAERGLRECAQLFGQTTPNEIPEAICRFHAGRQAMAQGNLDGALEQFRAGAKIPRERNRSLPEDLVMPFLEALFAEAERDPPHAADLHAEMFEAAQLIQSGVTAQLIGKAAARLASGDQRVSVALRQLQDADLEINTLTLEHDAETEKPAAVQDGKKLAQLRAAIADAETKRNAAEAAAQAAAPGYRQLVQAEASTQSVKETLGPSEGFFAVQVGRKSSFGFLVTRQEVTAFRVDLTLENAGKAVEHLRQTAQVGVDASGQIKIPAFDVAAAYRLYQQLLGPVSAKLAGLDRIVVSGSGPLLTLPFEMLVTEQTPPVANYDYRRVPFLLKRLAVSYVPAPQTFVLLRHVAPSAAAEPYIGFGDFRKPTRAQFAAIFPPDRCGADLTALTDLRGLPGTRQEVLQVAQLLGAPPRDILLGDKFTKSALLGADLKHYRVVHLATHGFLPTELRCLSQPSILMSVPPQAASARDAFLYSDEVENLKLDADLVILSACDTAGSTAGETSDKARANAGESLSALARSFFYAQARGLMVTHWSVDDDSAEFITTHLMATMKPGAKREDSTMALRQAKLDRLMTAGTPSGPSLVFSHPFAWAPFVLIGDGLHVPPATADTGAPPAKAGG